MPATQVNNQFRSAFCMAIWRRSGSETETLGCEAYQRFLGIEVERNYQRIIIINTTPYIYCSEHAVDFPTHETSLRINLQVKHVLTMFGHRFGHRFGPLQLKTKSRAPPKNGTQNKDQN